MEMAFPLSELISDVGRAIKERSVLCRYGQRVACKTPKARDRSGLVSMGLLTYQLPYRSVQLENDPLRNFRFIQGAQNDDLKSILLCKWLKHKVRAFAL